jgi:glucose/arabinose dehydrogenase
MMSLGSWYVEKAGAVFGLAVVAGLYVALAAPMAGASCMGDCDENGEVTVDELILGVNIALGARSLMDCPMMDGSGDAEVTINELIAAVGSALDGCPGVPDPTATPGPEATPTPEPTIAPTMAPMPFCDLPGSVRSTEAGMVVVPGGASSTSALRFLRLPIGFCAHFFANVGNARQLRFAPGGELFVASPTAFTTSDGRNGMAAIAALADDDGDGVAEVRSTYLGSLPQVHALLFANGYLYYQSATKILRVEYRSGDRVASGPSEEVADITIHRSGLHWPKSMDIADDGTIYVSNGGDQHDPCAPNYPFRGGILVLDGSPGGVPVAKGFRNPIAVRCSRGHNLCFAIELAKDYTAGLGGREKLVAIRQGGDWGFPCCATKDLRYPDVQPTDCSHVMTEHASFVIGHTPFDLDFETNRWPAPWNNRVYVPLHGVFGTWVGARVVAIEIDPETGEPLPGSDLSGMSSGSMMDFATGWDDGTKSHGRPTNVAFAPDGRLFLGNDTNGDIIWIAPFGLAP